jgi:electron transfer flavoprotein beta subunit
MNIIACCKATPEENDIVVLPDQKISVESAAWSIGTYDLNALEAGKRVVAETGGKMTALSVGGRALKESKLRKDILSRGPSELVLVINEEKELTDSLVAAKALSAAIQQQDSFDLIICGTGSADLYAQQVGNQLGALLQVPVVNNVSKITPSGEEIIVERTLENETEVLKITLPAVISVTSDINVPSIPGMKDIMGASKKPVCEIDISWSEIMPTTQVLSRLAAPTAERRMEILEGESEDIVNALVQFLQKELI